MKIKQTFEFEIAEEFTNQPKHQEIGNILVTLPRSEAEELLAALSEALGYDAMVLSSYVRVERPEEFDPNEDSWEAGSSNPGEMLTPDEAAARLQAMGQNSPNSSMPAGWKGSSTIGTRAAE